MHFALIDTVLEQSEGRILAVKQVTLAEEYLQDHFPTFHVLPGVFMLEALVQAARHLLSAQAAGAAGVADAPAQPCRWVLGGVRALRYGSFVRPGESLVVEVTLDKHMPDGTIVFKGSGVVRRAAGLGAPPAASPAAGAAAVATPATPGAPGAPAPTDAVPAAPARVGPETAVSGRFTMRPLRAPPQAPAGA